MLQRTRRIAIVGLHHEGLALALAFGRHGRVIGFDPDPRRVAARRTPHDFRTHHIDYSDNPRDLREADILLLTGPAIQEELIGEREISSLRDLCTLAGRHFAFGSLIVNTIQVPPGTTEQECIQTLEGASGRHCDEGFRMAFACPLGGPASQDYVLGAHDAETLELVVDLYGLIVPGTIHRAASLEAAERLVQMHPALMPPETRSVR